MDFKILWTPEAIARLEELAGYIAQDNPAAAARMGAAIFEKVQLLSAFPELGRVFRKLNRPDVREIPVRPYRVIYQVRSRKKTISILTVWHGARQEPEIILHEAG
ncbi:MAG: type II toxin-antitoxin system RelE/ParE family toxin [Verrucomicrobia bacterium]|nr:type II toxin-antitoxin system RelE/ParE family toxin [Verrucomicrobiota bacterium]